MGTLLLVCIGFLGMPFQVLGLSSTEAPLIEQVMTNHQGVCLQIGDSWLVTKGLQASDAGIFVLVEGEWVPLSEAVAWGEFEASWQCARCGRNNMDGISTCPYCGKSKNG